MSIELPEAPEGGAPAGARRRLGSTTAAAVDGQPGQDAVVSAPFRILTANVQSVPENAISTDQALMDLARNAADADLVLLQEIAFRYQPLIRDAFPSPEWEVYYGKDDNGQPIAFRTDTFAKVAGDVTLLHPARAGLHRRRYITHLRLRHRALDTDFHVTNLHLVSGAFNSVIEPDQEVRVEEWNEGILKHLALLERLAATGLPLVGGGDYNRQLRLHKSVGTTIAGRPVTYAVEGVSIDLLWFVDGTRARWDVRSRKVYPGRHGKKPARHSDHAARSATVTLAVRPKEAHMTTSVAPAAEEARSARGSSRPRGRTRNAKRVVLPGAFELTTFGDGTPKQVDWKTRSALEEAERRLGYPLTIVQGSYNSGGVSASAGTHDGGGVVDLLAWDWQRKVRVLRAIGFAAWYRPAIQGLWGAHIHAVLVDHGRLSASAARQVAAYRDGRDGLASNRVDPFWRPDPVPVFSYPPSTARKGPAENGDASRAVADAPATPPTGPAFPPRRTLDGVDTSHHQSGRIDLTAARNAGVRWWYVKATEGTTFTDSSYASRVRQARRAGIPVGAYHFARPDAGDAAEEARFFLSHTDLRAGDMLPMLDLESTEGLSRGALTTWVGTWVRTITSELTRKGIAGKPIIYTPFDLDDGFGCLLWVARYSNDYRAPVIPTPWKRAVIWQHSDGRFGPIRHVPGFGAVDVNALHPEVPLSALRLRPAGRRKRSGVPRPGHPTPHAPSADLDEARRQLQAAAASLQAALGALPER